MNIHIFTYFTVGFLIGFFSYGTFDSCFSKTKAPEEMNSEYRIIEKEAVKFKRPKILCVILTSPMYHQTRAIHVQKTWAKHCDKSVFISTKADLNLGSIGIDMKDDYRHLWGKLRLGLQYVHGNFIDEYDWIYKGDDDTFAVIENMRFLLSSYSPQDPIYFGHRFKTDIHKYGYLQGGSGYVMSNAALRLFVEKILTNSSLWQVKNDTGSEDWMIGKYFDIEGVYPVDARDPMKRERFLPFYPNLHLFPNSHKIFWYWERNYYNSTEGLGCLSNYAIATHSIKPQYMYTLHYLTYHLQLFGIQRRFPPIRGKVLFDDIVQVDEYEREILIKSLKNVKISQ